MAYIRLEYPKIQAFTDDGQLAIGYKVYTYVAGTDTPCTTYSDRLLSSENTNPIVLNARAEADLFTSQTIKLVLKTDVDVTVWTQDYVGEQLATFYTGSSADTTANVYNITVTPIPTEYTANMTVIWTPDVTNIDTLGTKTFTGTGANDCQITGPYVGTTSSTFRIEIDAAGSPDTFKWRKDSGSWTTGVAITADEQTLIEGIKVRFSVVTGHTLADYWVIDVDPPVTANVNSLGAKLVYKNMGGTMEALAGGDIIADYPATITYSDIQDCWILNNPATQTGSSLENYGIRYRSEKVDNYTLQTSDKGNLIDFKNTSTKTLTLDAAANYNNMFFYVRAGSTGNVQIYADGTELIKSVQVPTGLSHYNLAGGYGHTVQIQCNGIEWEILTETRGKIKKTIYSSPGTTTWTMDIDTLYAEVECYGGGKGGDRADSFPGSPIPSGGHAGGYVYKFIPLTSLGATETVTVGAAGVGRTSSTGVGTNGGTSSFGSHCSATGGTASSPGTGVSGHINLTGGSGYSFEDSTYVQCDISGGAGPGPLGGPMAPMLVGNVVGRNGNAVSGGGSGAYAANAGNGADGMVIVTEHK